MTRNSSTAAVSHNNENATRTAIVEEEEEIHSGTIDVQDIDESQSSSPPPPPPPQLITITPEILAFMAAHQSVANAGVVDDHDNFVSPVLLNAAAAQQQQQQHAGILLQCALDASAAAAAVNLALVDASQTLAAAAAARSAVLPDHHHLNGEEDEDHHEIQVPEGAIQLKAHRRSFTNEYKLQIVEYAKTHGITKTARHFGVSGSMVSRWLRRAPVYSACPASRRIGRAGRKPAFSDIEDRLADHINQLIEHGIPFSTSDVQSEMRNLVVAAMESGEVDQAKYDFKASSGWLASFMKRYNFQQTVQQRRPRRQPLTSTGQQDITADGEEESRGENDDIASPIVTKNNATLENIDSRDIVKITRVIEECSEENNVGH